jgi:MFS family permease
LTPASTIQSPPPPLAIITTTFAEGEERTKALGIWGGIAGAGGAFGLLLGGVLTDLLAWEWIFLVAVPIGIAVAVAALRLVPNWRSPRSWRSSAARRRRSSGSDCSGSARWRPPTASSWSSPARSSRLVFLASLYVRQILGYSPVQAGFAFLPVTAGIMGGAALSQVLIKRLGVKPTVVGGMSLGATGLVVLAATTKVDGSYLGILFGLVPMAWAWAARSCR